RATRLAAIAVVVFGVLGLLPVQAQGLFSPVLTINDRLITRYQLDQRIAFLTLLGVPTNQEEIALTQLSNEAIQIEAATDAGFAPTQEAIEAGQTEFAARANLNREQFIAALAQGGVGVGTFNDFVGAGVAWRAYVQNRFRSDAEAIQPGVLDRALETAQIEAGRRVRLFEIVLPANTPDAERISRARAAGFSQMTDLDAFGEAASQFSLAQTRFRNGEAGWRALSALPEPIANAVRNLPPGRATQPVAVDNAIAVYYVAEAEQTPRTTAAFASVDYASLQLGPSGSSDAGRILSRLDQCDDLLAESGRFPETAYQRQITLLSSLAPDVRGAIEALDAGEASASVNRAGGPVIVMVCRRTFGETGEIDLTQLRLGLINQRLQLLANRHINELREQAVVVRPEGG
ncbi:MAG: peptidylprolyl isomerase, partial [Pseudomonadota bacterium]